MKMNDIPQPSGERPDGMAVRRDDPCEGAPAPTAAADASALRHGHRSRHNSRRGVGLTAAQLQMLADVSGAQVERLRDALELVRSVLLDEKPDKINRARLVCDTALRFTMATTPPSDITALPSDQGGP